MVVRLNSPFYWPKKGDYHGAAWIMIFIMIAIFYYTREDVLSLADSLVFKPAEWSERPWAAATHLFVHLNWQHLLLNVFLFLQFGPTLERRIGTKRFLAVFFICGVMGAVFDVLYIRNGITLGASGAVLGVMACLTAIDRDNKIMLLYPPVVVSIMVAVMFYFIMDFFMLGAPGINNLAHLVGATTGFILGYGIIEKAW